jgi:uncharacterized protein YceK
MMRRVVLCVVCVAFLCGCGSYYKVTDPTSKNIYYTEDIDQIKNGAIKFKDARAGSQVTLQSSEIKEINSKEFEEAIKAGKSEVAK